MIKINGIFLFQFLVLKYVQNKDVFMRYYKVYLIRRLILDILVDNEKEENMVEWLRVSNYYIGRLLLIVIRYNRGIVDFVLDNNFARQYFFYVQQFLQKNCQYYFIIFVIQKSNFDDEEQSNIVIRCIYDIIFRKWVCLLIT